MRTRTLLAVLALVLVGCFHDHGLAAGDAGRDAGAPPDGDASLVLLCPTLGGYATCDVLCETGCPGDGLCHQHFHICRVFAEATGCSITLASTEADYPDRTYCKDGQVCVVADEVLEADGVMRGLCVREAYCREMHEVGVEARCRWSDETEFVAGAPELTTCPPSVHGLVRNCGGPCGGCDTGPWSRRYALDASCTGVSERRGFGVCTFNGSMPCSPGDPGVTPFCPADWGEPCACLLLQLPDGTFNRVGYPTLASVCRDYRSHFPDSVRCMEPDPWRHLE